MSTHIRLLQVGILCLVLVSTQVSGQNPFETHFPTPGESMQRRLELGSEERRRSLDDMEEARKTSQERKRLEESQWESSTVAARNAYPITTRRTWW